MHKQAMSPILMNCSTSTCNAAVFVVMCWISRTYSHMTQKYARKQLAQQPCKHATKLTIKTGRPRPSQGRHSNIRLLAQQWRGIHRLLALEANLPPRVIRAHLKRTCSPAPTPRSMISPSKDTQSVLGQPLRTLQEITIGPPVTFGPPAHST